MVFRVYVEKKHGFDLEARTLTSDVRELLGIGSVENIRVINRYDAEGMEKELFDYAIKTVFSEPQMDVAGGEINTEGATVFGTEYLPGQFDQRADSAAQCIQMLSKGERPVIRTAKIYAVYGKVSKQELETIKRYVINPVESREAEISLPETLKINHPVPQEVETLTGFLSLDQEGLNGFVKKYALAMDEDDIAFCQDYFKKEERDPTLTEIRMIDTYWSDHCRHTTFLTTIDGVHFEDKVLEEAYGDYLAARKEINRTKPVNLMDVGTIACKLLKQRGLLNNLDESEEINACTVKIKVDVNGKQHDYLLLFKNETHNHPTEIEPFGGAATCIGGAIRDPLSGRSYVYAAMRVTGAGDPLVPVSETLEGKLPQRKIVTTAAAGYSSYGNQIGLATGQVDEIYHTGYVAKRLEIGAVIASTPEENVRRETPAAGDKVILLGGRTGRDGCGGATGSSKSHTLESLTHCGAEVQKGNAPEERKLQRLFRKKEAMLLVKRCNDFGAGGVSVAIGELADGLKIDLNAVPKKYDGLDGTELAISESQERMAVVVAPQDASKFISLAAKENLSATPVATVTGDRRMRMYHRGKAIVDISRDFLDTNGVKQVTDAEIADFVTSFFDSKKYKNFGEQLKETLSQLNVCSKKGLVEMFDSTIGSKSVYMPFGGKFQLTPVVAMAAKFTGGETDDCTVSAYGYNPELMSTSSFTGAVYSIVASVAKIVAAGGQYEDIRLSLQEFFMRLRNNKKRWGVPVSALLGALYAQMHLGLAAIGGKDSMSGSFEDIDVPPTLISFALAPAKASALITNVITRTDERLYFLPMRKDKSQIPDFEYLKKLYKCVNKNIANGNIRFATVVEQGGVAAAIAKSCFGNGFGFNFACNAHTLFGEHYGDLIISANHEGALTGLDAVYLGTSCAGGFTHCGETVDYVDALYPYISKLFGVFPASAPASGDIPSCDYIVKSGKASAANKIIRPRVFIPVFPGTNCELDTARAFRLAGAQTDILVIKNRTPSDIEDSVKAIIKAIEKANIIAFPGGFSGGDEPDGSGKFIATTFKNPAISEKIMELLQNRDGLILGICNGFQALIKLGLLPYGKICPLTDKSPTLTYNNISRHVSTMVNIRVASDKSPWLYGCEVGDVYAVPVSHGEGKLIAPPAELEAMRSNGQIATQYVDLSGRPTMKSPYNPNGSMWAIEGITSPDGKVFGKMGHSERTGVDLYKNYEGNFDMHIFESGVKYFR